MIDQKAMFSLTHGLYVLGATEVSGRFVGSVVDAVMQGATSPNLLCLSCMNNSYTKTIIEETKELALSVIPKDVVPNVISNFGFQSSKNVDKWDNVAYEVIDNLPILKNCVAYLTCKVLKKDIYNSHSIFIIEVLNAVIKDGGDVLTYTDYQQYFKNKVIEGFKK